MKRKDLKNRNAKIVRLYNQNVPVHQIAKMFKLAESTILNVVRKSGKTLACKERRAVGAYIHGEKTTAIKKKYKIGNLYRLLDHAEVPRRNPNLCWSEEHRKNNIKALKQPRKKNRKPIEQAFQPVPKKSFWQRLMFWRVA